MNILASAVGRYAAVGDPEAADAIIGHSFGTDISDSGVNGQLAKFILGIANGRPIIADLMLVNAFPKAKRNIAHVVDGPISNTFGQGVGTWGTLLEAKDFMDKNGYKLAMQVAHACHVGRVFMQAKKLDMASVVPPGLPRQFDSGSNKQRFTRSLPLWVLREVPGSIILRAQGKL